LWLILAGGARTRQSQAPPAFAVERGAAEAAELVAATGTADLQLQAFAGASQLVVGQFPGLEGPQVNVGEAATRVLLTTRLAAPLLPGRCWSAALAKALPWTLELSSSLGDFTLDLRELSVEAVRLRTTVGHVDLTLPAAGQCDLDLRLALGDVTLRVPEETAVRIKVTAGSLATLRVESRRFVELAPGEWASPLFAVSPNRCTLALRLGAGELRLV
jgi:hypothetical protein